MSRILFILSGLITTIAFFNQREIHVLLSLTLSLAVLIYLSDKVRYESKFTMKIPILLNAVIISYSVTSNLHRSAIGHWLTPWVALPAVTYFLFHYLAWFYLGFAKGIFLHVKNSINVTHQMKWFFGIGASLLLFTLFAINRLTPVFFAPSQSHLASQLPHEYLFFDVLFQTDTNPLFVFDHVFMLDVPSSRQPLFSLFSFPLVAPLYGLSRLLFFIPNLYPTLLMWLQFLLAFATGVLLYIMVRKSLSHPKLFFAFYLSTYVMMVFPLILERFIFGLFYLVVLIYSYWANREERHFAIIGAMGTNLLSLAMGGFLIMIHERLWGKLALKLGGLFLAFVVVFGRLPLFFYGGTLEDSTRWLTLEVGLWHQLMQFSHFIWGSFLFPATAVHFYIYPRYEQAIVSGFHLGGLLIVVVSLLTAIRYRNVFFVRVAAFWFGISFVLLGLLGWSAQQHNLILFASFFSFGVVYLFYLFLEQALAKFQHRSKILGGLVSLLIVYNIFGLWDLLAFALRYYHW